MEKYMKNICKDLDNQDYKALLIAYLHWLIDDILHETNQAEIFEYLYMTPNRTKTYLKMSMELYVNQRTLERYRKKYVKSFKAARLILDKLHIILEVE